MASTTLAPNGVQHGTPHQKWPSGVSSSHHLLGLAFVGPEFPRCSAKKNSPLTERPPSSRYSHRLCLLIAADCLTTDNHRDNKLPQAEVFCPQDLLDDRLGVVQEWAPVQSRSCHTEYSTYEVCYRGTDVCEIVMIAENIKYRPRPM